MPEKIGCEKMQKIKALGMIEVYGRLGAIEALDACLKAAETVLTGMVKVGGGLSTVLVEGDVAAVKAAVDAGSAAAQRVSRVISVHVIPRPHPEVWEMLNVHRPSAPLDPEPEPEPKKPESEKPKLGKMEPKKKLPEKKVPDEAKKEEASQEDAGQAELAKMTVSALRRAARETEGFPMTKEEIKFAKKGELLTAFAKLNMK